MNSTDSPKGLLEAGAGWLSSITKAPPTSTTVVMTLVIGAVLILPVLSALFSPKLDPNEPPLLKPRIPFIGHIISLMRHQNEFSTVLHKANPSYSIATLPMLNGRMYSVFDPYMMQSLLRNKLASFEQFALEFSQKAFDLPEETMAKVRDQPLLISSFTDIIHKSFGPVPLKRMNVEFLGSLAQKLHQIDRKDYVVDASNSGQEATVKGGIQVSNLYLWTRHVMSLASTQSLYGDNNPFENREELIDDIWQYETALPMFLLSLYPSITMPKGYQARSNLQKLLTDYFEAGHHRTDPSCSAIIANRAKTLSDFGFTPVELGLLESFMPVVATTNAVPTMFWMLVFVMSRPELVKDLRDEVSAIVNFSVSDKDGECTAHIDIAEFEEKLPLMVSCYHETLRVVNHSVSSRRLMEDVVVRNADGSQSYLLKKGFDVQLPAGVAHGRESAWGFDAAEFNGRRFLKKASRSEDGNSQADKAQRMAYIPFGGGRHLCPGRNLAFCEILGFMGMMLLRFEIEPVGMGFRDIKINGATLAGATCKPVKEGRGLGARIVAREGWEKTKFEFKC